MARYVVGRVEELPPGTSRLLPDAGPWGIGVFNVAGTYYALNNLCPHAGAQVCRGMVTGTTEAIGPYRMRWVRDGEILRCPWHSWEIDITTGRTLTDPRLFVKQYPVYVEDGLIIVEI